MKRQLYLGIIVLLVSALACGVPSSPPAEPTANALPPTPDLPFSPSSIPQDQLGNSQPVVTAQFSTTIRDEFDGKLSPGIGWNWLRQDQSGWSLTATPGWLRINLSTNGYLAGLPSNVLTTSAPQGDFDLRTSVKFSPTQNFEFAGLIVLFDEKVILQVGRAFCNLRDCQGSGYYFDNLQNGATVGGNFGIASSSDLGQLRMVRQENTYTAYYQMDDANWVLIGNHTMNNQPVSVGLIAAQAPAAGSYAEFDYIEINQP